MGRPFPKGESGNPGGRPKDVGLLREMAREHTAEALNVLVQAMRDDDPRIRVAAASAILDRGHGKPTTPIEVEAPVDAEPISMLEIARRIAFILDHARREVEVQADPEQFPRVSTPTRSG